jgi:hypothetical protein
MRDQLIWVETLLKGAVGLVLLIAPTLTAAVLGLPRSGPAFWPRLLGAVLIGIAIASALEARAPATRGLALGGSVAINLAAGAFLGSLAILYPLATRRGRAVLWLLVAGLLLLSLIEMAIAAEVPRAPG